MNALNARAFAVRLTIVVALTAAGWQFIIRPMRTRVVERRAEIEAMRQEIDASTQAIEAQRATPEQVITDLRGRAADLRELWAVSADASRLYERFDALAHRYGITIERMEPKAAASQGTSPKDEEDTPHIAEIGYSIELVATYDAVARFFRAVQGETGMVRVESFRIAPEESSGREPLVRASLRTVHYQVTGGLAAFTPTAGGPP